MDVTLTTSTRRRTSNGREPSGLAGFTCPRMAAVMQPWTLKSLGERMHRPAIPDKEQLQAASREERLSALSAFGYAYLPTPDEIQFTFNLIAKVQQVYRAKQFGESDFKRYFHHTAEVLKGRPLAPLASCLSTIKGTTFSIHGPAAMGRTALIQRIITVMGKPFAVDGTHPAPAKMIVIPVLVLQPPSCGTTKGIIRDIREKILELIGNSHTRPNALSELNGPNAENAAIALCTVLNVGLIIFDGGSFNNVSRNTQSMFAFLLKLRDATGIPMLLSGTSAFMYSTTFMCNIASNTFNGPTLHLDAPLPPEHSSIDTPRAASGKWNSICTWFWRQAFIPSDCEMPKWMSVLTYQLTCGRIGWLAQGFEQLHMDLTQFDVSRVTEIVTSDFVTKSFNKRLRLHSSARVAVAAQQTKSSTGIKTSLLKHIDHFSHSDLEEPRISQWLDEFLIGRIQ